MATCSIEQEIWRRAEKPGLGEAGKENIEKNRTDSILIFIENLQVEVTSLKCWRGPEMLVHFWF